MKRKIYFDIVIANKFNKVDYGYATKFDVPDGNEVFIVGLPIEFEQTSDSEVMENAFDALYKYITKYYPAKDYRVYYWVLERID